MIEKNRIVLLVKISGVLFFIGLISIIIKGFMPEWIDSSGVLHEPYFFMLPLGFGSIFLSLILGATAFVKSMTGLKK